MMLFYFNTLLWWQTWNILKISIYLNGCGCGATDWADDYIFLFWLIIKIVSISVNYKTMLLLFPIDTNRYNW